MGRLRGLFPPVFRYLQWGAKIPGFATAVGHRLREELPNATLRPIDDSYALTPEDQPAALAEMIVGFCS